MKDTKNSSSIYTDELLQKTHSYINKQIQAIFVDRIQDPC